MLLGDLNIPPVSNCCSIRAVILNESEGSAFYRARVVQLQFRFRGIFVYNGSIESDEK